MNTEPNGRACTDQPGPDEELNALRAKLPALEAELAAQKDRYLRLAADFENFRRRTAEESDRRAAAQKEAFIAELLPVIDNLERALANAGSSSPRQFQEGVEMTLRQLHQVLRHHGVEAEESLGAPFDPRRHEGIATRRDPSRPDHTVLEVFQRGYRRGDRVIRPAKVVVNDLSPLGASNHAG